MSPIGFIGGTGVRAPAAAAEPVQVTTAWGEACMQRLTLGGREVCFIRRHGLEGGIPPHRVNYRANIRALQILGCRAVLATNAVGSLDEAQPPGRFVLPDQFLDLTKARAGTFYDGARGVVHVDMTEPYCRRLRAALVAAGQEVGEQITDGAVYACTEGPRFETPAEIRMLRQWGAHVVGMTGVPEVVLAREAGLCYATLSVVSNWAAGMSPAHLTETEVHDMMLARREAINAVLEAACAALEPDAECGCSRAASWRRASSPPAGRAGCPTILSGRCGRGVLPSPRDRTTAPPDLTLRALPRPPVGQTILSVLRSEAGPSSPWTRACDLLPPTPTAPL